MNLIRSLLSTQNHLFNGLQGPKQSSPHFFPDLFSLLLIHSPPATLVTLMFLEHTRPTLLPQDLFTCWFLCLKLSSHRYLHYLLSLLPEYKLQKDRKYWIWFTHCYICTYCYSLEKQLAGRVIQQIVGWVKKRQSPETFISVLHPRVTFRDHREQAHL